MNDILKTISSILLKIFILGVAITLLSAALYYGYHDFYVNLIVKNWRLTDEASLNVLALKAYTDVKIYLFYGALVPALAIRWQLHCNKKHDAN